MPDILFLPIETENPLQQLIEFEVISNGKHIRCSITYDALNVHFDAENSDPLFAFMSGRPKIESLIAQRIKNGNNIVDENILIDASDF
jgi:hypothetical protein